MTPNDSHLSWPAPRSVAGFDVICDKPMTNTVDEAERLHAAVEASGRVFCPTHNYTGYPMVRQARGMVETRANSGTIRLVQVEYVQGGNAQESDPSPEQSWRHNPAKGGPSLVMGDIGSHAHNLLRFITGLEVASCGWRTRRARAHRMTTQAPCCASNGARQRFWVTQAAAGVENCLRIRVSGTQGTLSGNRSAADPHLQTGVRSGAVARRTGRARFRWRRARRLGIVKGPPGRLPGRSPTSPTLPGDCRAPRRS